MTAYYCKYGKCKGQVTIKELEDSFELTSFKWKIERNINSAVGGLTREADAPQIGEFYMTKRTDGASTKLLEDAVIGKLDNDCWVKVVKTDADGVTVFLTCEAKKCGLKRYAPDSGSGDELMEELVIGFEEVSMKYETESFGYNLIKRAKQ